MTEIERKIKTAQRLEVVTAYLYGSITYAEFSALFNAEKVFKRLHIKTGDITAGDLERWVCGCYKTVSGDLENGGAL